MKKLFLILIIIPCLSFSQDFQSFRELLDVYSNAACAYWSVDESGRPNDMLFNGGPFDIKSPDVAKADKYKCDCFAGPMFEAASMIIIFDVMSDGKKQLSSIEFYGANDNTAPDIYFQLNKWLGGD